MTLSNQKPNSISSFLHFLIALSLSPIVAPTSIHIVTINSYHHHYCCCSCDDESAKFMFGYFYQLWCIF